MRKKIVFFLFVIAPLLCLSALRAQEASGASSPFDRLTFSIGGEAIGVWEDAQSGVYYAFLPSHAEATAVLSLPSGIVADIGGQMGLTADAPCAVPYGEPQSVTFYSAGGTVLETGALIFMRSENLPSIFLHTLDGGLGRIHADKEHEEQDVTIAIFGPDGREEPSSPLAYVKGRGSSTWMVSEKRPYSLAFEQPADLFGMGAHTNWTLLANSMDDSRLRNKIVYDTARAAGMAYTPEEQFADLYVNGEYRGLYQLIEKPQIAPTRVDISDLEGRALEANRARLSSFPLFSQGEGAGSVKGANIPRDPEDITGGYLLEMSQFEDRYREASSGMITQNGIPIIVESPKYASKGQMAYISGVVQRVEDALYSGDPAICDLLDMPSWVATYLLEEIFMDVDASMTSQYFYKDSDAASGLLYSGPAWDFDLTMGNTLPTRNPETLYAMRPDQYESLPERNWFSLLYANGAFYSMVTEEYAETFRPLLLDWIGGGIGERLGAIEAAAWMDSARWGWEDVWTKDSSLSTPQARADALRAYLERRVAFLDSVWLRDETYHTVRVLRTQLGERTLFFSIPSGGFLPASETGIGPTAQRALTGLFYAGTDRPYDDSLPITEDLTLEARWAASSSTADKLRLWAEPALVAASVGALLLFLAILLIWERRQNGPERRKRRAGERADG